MLTPKTPRLPEPAIPDDVTGFELDRSVKNQLRTLSKENAVGVGQHLVMAAAFLDTDIDAAQAHAETAVRRAGRVPAAREALGLVHYRKGEWAKALSEFRTARRLSGSSHMLPFMVDAERGLGRHERALDLAASPEAASLTLDERIELAIVVSGIRRDLGQYEAAVVGLQLPQLNAASRQPWAARLFYAYAEALLARGDEAGALTWFGHAANADLEGETDADERLAELDGLVLTDLLEGEDDEELEDDELEDDEADDEDLDEEEYQGEDEEQDEEEYQGESTPDLP
jgi:tetratricopeptide (TPR) repeat protein